MQFQARIEDRDMQLINVTIYRVEYACGEDSVVCILFVSIVIDK